MPRAWLTIAGLTARLTPLTSCAKVAGIGPKTLEKVRPWVFVDEAGAGPATFRRTRGNGGAPASAPPARTSKAAALVGPINVNNAGVAELQKLPGIGPKLAQRIVDSRTLRGRFRSVEELRRVSGIGPKTLEKLRPHVIINAPVAVAGS